MHSTGSHTGNVGLVEKAAIPHTPKLVARLNTVAGIPRILGRTKDISVFQLIPRTDALTSPGIFSTYVSIPIRFCLENRIFLAKLQGRAFLAFNG